MSGDPRLLGDCGDESLCNESANPTFASLVEQRLGRRAVMRGGLQAAVAVLTAGSLLGAGLSRAAAAQPLLGFEAVPVSDADTLVVPPGYRAQVLLPWGEPLPGGPAFDLANSGADQAGQVGSHHDGMHFFPIEGASPYEGSSEDGLLVMNHEYVEPRFMHAASVGESLDSNQTRLLDGRRDADEVLKEINGHGVSVVRIRRQDDGSWQAVEDPRNRRVTGLTPMTIAGPVRGSDFVKTAYSPAGEETRGTLNNCAHGVTPWNTYLAAEENWAGYFRNGDAELPREHKRYGVRTETSRYGWDLADSEDEAFRRFDASSLGAEASEDFRNEPNCFGWVVEIDPFDPASAPVKRTALGRFAHEGVVFGPATEGRPLVCYAGDDARFEYIYKFVSARPYEAATADGSLLDEGRLYVARFDEDGSGEWLALVFGENGLTPEHGFTSQADVLVNTRLAADHVGATKMDRPEWGAVDPVDGSVYFTLTNNSRRAAEQVDAVNPRAENQFGHIVRWREAGGDHTAERFEWDLFVLAGDTESGQDLSGTALDESNIFASPDGLWFDAARRLWIQTDISESVMNQGIFAPFGNNQMLAADPVTGEIRRFLTGPIGQEITGVITTPDRRTMFVNVQHPGATTSAEDFAAGTLASHWPEGGSAYPRSATVVITREDGGEIGA